MINTKFAVLRHDSSWRCSSWRCRPCITTCDDGQRCIGTCKRNFVFLLDFSSFKSLQGFLCFVLCFCTIEREREREKKERVCSYVLDMSLPFALTLSSSFVPNSLVGRGVIAQALYSSNNTSTNNTNNQQH